MPRFASALGILLMVPSTLLAIELPKPPDGFKWREVKSIKGAFLVPDGWHFRAEEAKGTLAFFITKDEFIPPEQYLVGMSINAFLGNPGAPSQVEKHLRTQAENYQVELVPGKFGPFVTLQCQYDLAKTAEHDATRIVYLGIVNPKTNASYLVMFESPVDGWDQAWSKGHVVIESFALNGKI